MSTSEFLIFSFYSCPSRIEKAKFSSILDKMRWSVSLMSGMELAAFFVVGMMVLSIVFGGWS